MATTKPGVSVNKAIADWLKEKRVKSGLTNAQIIKGLNHPDKPYTEKEILKFEDGTCDLSFCDLCRLAAVYKIPEVDIIGLINLLQVQLLLNHKKNS